MKNIVIIGSGHIGGLAGKTFVDVTNARHLKPLAEPGIQPACGKGHGGEVGFTFAPVN